MHSRSTRVPLSGRRGTHSDRWFCIAALCAAQLAITASHADTAPSRTDSSAHRPGLVSSTPAGIAAYEALALAYETNAATQPTRSARDSLEHGSPRSAQDAQEFLLALARQSLADESNGRARWTATPYWGGGEESVAREFRLELLSELAEIRRLDRASTLLEWFVLHEPRLDLQRAAASLLVSGAGNRTEAVMHRVVSDPHPHSGVLAIALREIAARRSVSELRAVTRLVNHPFRSIRALAESVTVVLGAPRHSSSRPSHWLSHEIQMALRAIADAIHPRPPSAAPIVRLRLSGDTASHGDPRGAPQTAWLLDSTNTEVRVLDLFARERRFPRNALAIERWSLEAEVDRLVRIRSEGNLTSLSREGGLTAQFEGPGPALPEILVASWAWSRGDADAAARTILPALEAASSSAALRSIAEQKLSTAFHHQMLEAFSYDWDYPRAAGYARALQRRLFAGQPHLAISREFERQLRRRASDFHEFALPDSATWDSLRRVLGRREQFEYLLPRLRLLNAFQEMQPGDVAFGTPQYATPSRRRGPWSNGEPRTGVRIHPLEEIGNLAPTLADVPVLLRSLDDRNFLPTFGFWRDFHAARTHYQVGELIEGIINAIADQPLVSFVDYQALSRPARERYRATIETWARSHAGWSKDELNLEVLRTTRVQNVFWVAAEKAAKRGHIASAPVIVRRRPEFREVATYLDQAVARFDSTALDEVAWRTLLADDASEWARASEDSGLTWQQIWAAQRVQRRQAGTSRARLALARALDAEPTGEWAVHWASPILALDSIAMAPVLCRQMGKARFLSEALRRDDLIATLIDHGCDPALRHYLWVHFLREVQFLRARIPPESAKDWVRRAHDHRKVKIASRAARWPDAPKIDPAAPMDRFAEQVEAFRAWLSEYCVARAPR